MTTTRDTHSNPMGCIDEIRARWSVPKALIQPDGDHSPWQAREDVQALLAAYDAATAERDALHKMLAGTDVHVGDLLPPRPVKDDPAMSREMLAESQRGVEQHMVDIGRIGAERDALKARVEELEGQVREVLSNVRVADIYNTAGMEELAYRVGHWTRPPQPAQTPQLEREVKGGDMGKEPRA